LKRCTSWVHSFSVIAVSGPDEGSSSDGHGDDACTDERADACIRPLEPAPLDTDDDRGLLFTVGRWKADGKQESGGGRSEEAGHQAGAQHSPTVAPAGYSPW
jgi:hypothetical protein